MEIRDTWDYMEINPFKDIALPLVLSIIGSVIYSLIVIGAKKSRDKIKQIPPISEQSKKTVKEKAFRVFISVSVAIVVVVFIYVLGLNKPLDLPALIIIAFSSVVNYRFTRDL